jgi:hypothetical protein
MEIKFIERYCPPTRYDAEPFGTHCTVNNESTVDIWLQISKTDDIKWVMMDRVVADMYRDKFNDENYIKEILKQI